MERQTTQLKVDLAYVDRHPKFCCDFLFFGPCLLVSSFFLFFSFFVLPSDDFGLFVAVVSLLKRNSTGITSTGMNKKIIADPLCSGSVIF